MACASGLEHAFHRDLRLVRRFVESRRRSEPELGLRLAASERRLQDAAAGVQAAGAALSGVHGDMLELHLRATTASASLARGPFYAYRIEVIYPLTTTRSLKNLIAALS